MVFKVGPLFDAIREQCRLSADKFGLQNVLDSSRSFLIDPNSTMSWNSARLNQNVFLSGFIVGADLQLLRMVSQAICQLASAGLEKEEWKPKTVPLKDDDPRKKWHGLREVELRVRPWAWFAPKSVLLFHEWLEKGIVDHKAVTAMLSCDLMGKSAIEGVWHTDELMPLSAWPQIMELPSTPDPQGGKRKQDATDRLGMMLAEDPGQLHDPKSPARKKARNYMRGSMSQRWLVSGLTTTAVNWLRTFEWREGQSGLSPRETLLRAYAYMPEVEAPANIAEEVRQLRLIPI